MTRIYGYLTLSVFLAFLVGMSAQASSEGSVFNGTQNLPSKGDAKLYGSKLENSQSSKPKNPTSASFTPKSGVFFAEDFGDGVIPAGWENNPIQGGFGWEWTNAGGNFGGQLASTTAANGYVMFDSDRIGGKTGGVGGEEVDLITPSFSLAAASGDVTFSVEHWARSFAQAEVYISISSDNFASDETILYSWIGSGGDTNGPNPVVSNYDISAYAGEADVRIKFKWIGDWDYWWLVDDIVVRADGLFSDRFESGSNGLVAY